MHYPQGSYGKRTGASTVLTNPYALAISSTWLTRGPQALRKPSASMTAGSPCHSRKIIAPNSLHNGLGQRTQKEGSGFQTVDEQTCSNQRPMVPTGLLRSGPGRVCLLADWYGTRLSHVRPRGRLAQGERTDLRVKPRSAPAHRIGDLAKMEGRNYSNCSSKPLGPAKALLEIGWQEKRSLAPSLIKKIRANIDKSP